MEKLAEATKIIKEVTEELRKMKIRRFREKKGYGENSKKDKSESAKY